MAMPQAPTTSTPTPYRFYIDPNNTGLWKCTQTEEVARTTSEVLQQDLEKHHVFFNQKGYHNHITHHLLSLYGTGASATAIQKAYAANASYQMPAQSPHPGTAAELQQDWATHAPRHLGQGPYYPDFLCFFQAEIAAKGWQSVLLERVFADDLVFPRLFEGFLHPLIQLMYGIEFAQPAIVAQGLAQACVHGARLRSFLFEAEARARARARDVAHGGADGGGMPSMVSLYEAVGAHPTLGTAARQAAQEAVDDSVNGQGVDAVLDRAREPLLDLVARIRVRPEELDERTAEMYDASFYVAASAALEHYPQKYPKFDFFLIHHCNVGPIFLAINALPGIPVEAKVRVLEWKMRMDLLQYAARACPPLTLDKMAAYEGEHATGRTASEIVARMHDLSEDDGHAIKLGRAAVLCHGVSSKYRDRDWVRLKTEDVWLKVDQLIVDSVLAPGPSWVRITGAEKAWKDVPNKPDTKL